MLSWKRNQIFKDKMFQKKFPLWFHEVLIRLFNAFGWSQRQAYSEPVQISKVGLFCKGSILDVWLGCECVSRFIYWKSLLPFPSLFLTLRWFIIYVAWWARKLPLSDCNSITNKFLMKKICEWCKATYSLDSPLTMGKVLINAIKLSWMNHSF